MTDPKPPKRIFPEASTDARAAKHVPGSPQTESEAYKLAFQDTDFLLRPDLRPVRFQLELLKPELMMNEAGIVRSGDAASLGIGAMTEERWGRFHGTMASVGLVPRDLEWRRAFDLSLVNKGIGRA